MQTEVELESGQSFVIAGLMDNRMTETISKIPGLASIPLLGKLFTSKAISRNNSELLVIVTPEVVRPIPAGQPLALAEHARSLHDEEQRHRDAAAGYGQDRTGAGEAAIGLHACRTVDPAAQGRPGGSAGHDGAIPNRAHAGTAPPSVNPGLTPSAAGGAGK